MGNLCFSAQNQKPKQNLKSKNSDQNIFQAHQKNAKSKYQQMYNQKTQKLAVKRQSRIQEKQQKIKALQERLNILKNGDCETLGVKKNNKLFQILKVQRNIQLLKDQAKHEKQQVQNLRKSIGQ